jgi:Na+-translocating ferredoxin:NAD+ oxidoreductase RnfA subunit
MNKFLKICDEVFTVIFVCEMVMKVIARGFIFNGKRAYLRNGWNVLDFIIVLTSVVDFIPGISSSTSLKVLRMLRVFRPLRLVSHN